MNVALVRVLDAHALVGAPRLALGRARSARPAPRRSSTRYGRSVPLARPSDLLRTRYSLAPEAVASYIGDEHRLGRLLDYAVIVPRLQRLYEWSAEELGESQLLNLVRDGNPIYAWPFEERDVWRSPRMPRVGRALERATRAR